MKKLMLFGIASVACLSMVTTSCNDDSIFQSSDGEGKLSLKLGIDTEVLTSAGGSRAADDRKAPTPRSISVNDLTIKLTSADGTRTYAVDLDDPKSYPVGDYTIEASYGNPDDEGFELPYYYGTSDLTIEENRTTEVSMEVLLANSMFTVHYTDGAKAYFEKYSTVFVSEAGNEVVYASDETRPVYVRSGNIAVYADVTLPGGKSGRVPVVTCEAAPRYHYDITVDVKGGASDAKLLVSFDDDLIEENITLDLGDELSTASAPRWTLDGFESGTTMACVQSIPFTGDLKMNLMARGGIGSVKLTTSNNIMLTPRWPSEIDLTQATPAEQALLSEYGLKVLGLYKNPDQMAVIDFKEVLSHLAVNGVADPTISFTVEVTDKNGKTTDPVTLKVSLEELKLSIVQPIQYTAGDEKLTFGFNYNGYDITAVKFYYYNDRSTWSGAHAVAVNNGGGSYTVTMDVPGLTSSFSIKATLGDDISVTAPVDVLSFNYDKNDIWSNKISFSVTNGTGGDITSQIKGVKISTDGTNYADKTFSYADGKITLAGLDYADRTPVVYVKVSTTGAADSFRGPGVFTLETKSQIPNADMESWCQDGNGKNWELIYPGVSSEASIWGTNNPMTTSQGSDYAYCRISGTISTTDAHSGSAAALIRTVGWGSGNTATGSGGNSGKTKYIDAGLLHLGSSRAARPSGYSGTEGALTTTDLNCGMILGSRPASMSFWYKYTAKNSSDKGYAEVCIYDIHGKEIASGTVDLSAATEYTQVTVPLAYPAGCARASMIYVKFLSTNDRSFLQKSDANLSGPGFANLSRGTFMGSQLYIDDITLNY